VALVMLLLAALPIGVFAQTTPEQSGTPDHGLMWNRTGLPSVFPLQVKTNAGESYVLLLSDPETGADVLGAFIVGGRFFKVLVPPGTYRVRFASGVRWQGDDTMFGRRGETKIIEMPESLTFEVRGLRTKAGHLIDLTDVGDGDLADLRIAPSAICQRVVWSFDRCGDLMNPLRQMRIECQQRKGLETKQLYERTGFSVRSAVCS
jgi:hypothetical protein